MSDFESVEDAPAEDIPAEDVPVEDVPAEDTIAARVQQAQEDNARVVPQGSGLQEGAPVPFGTGMDPNSSGAASAQKEHDEEQ